jgi:hypothetical protein
MTEMLRELDDRWILPLRGHHVTGFDLGDSVAISVEPNITVEVGYGAVISVGMFAPDDSEYTRLAWPPTEEIRIELSKIVGAKVLSAVGFKSGTLRIAFGNKLHLNIPRQSQVDGAVIREGIYLWRRTAGVVSSDSQDVVRENN